MNYLQRASRHISSSAHMSRRKSRWSIFIKTAISVCVLLIALFLFRKSIHTILLSFKSVFISNEPHIVQLTDGAIEAHIKALELENGELRSRFDGNGESGSTSTTQNRLDLQSTDIVAPVIMRPPQMPYDTLTVAVGQKQGVSVGDKVYAFNGYPIGEIQSIDAGYSSVRLYSSPGQKFEVLIGTSTTAVLAEGRGGGNFALKLPKITDIREGDFVVKQYFPPETLSVIDSVDSAEGEAYTYAYFKLPIHINSLVYVIIKKNTH